MIIIRESIVSYSKTTEYHRLKQSPTWFNACSVVQALHKSMKLKGRYNSRYQEEWKYLQQALLDFTDVNFTYCEEGQQFGIVHYENDLAVWDCVYEEIGRKLLCVLS